MAVENTPLTMETTIQRMDSVIHMEVEDELYMMDAASNQYYALNPIGVEIWNALETPRTVGALCADLARTHGERPERVQADMADFLADMVANGLIRTVD